MKKILQGNHNLYLSDDEYSKMVSENIQYYPTGLNLSASVDYAKMAFLNHRDNTVFSDIKESVIPLGDLILSSFTLDRVDYYCCHSGYYMKKKQSKIIEKCDDKRYLLAKSFLTIDMINHVELLENAFYHKFDLQKKHVPLAGLTRGFNSHFSTSKEDRLNEIQSKYLNGVH